MVQTTGFSAFKLDCETLIAKITLLATYWGLRVVRSFDLRSAYATYPDSTCPYHGVSPCDCQLVVLLIYGVEATPASVLLRSHRGITELALIDPVDNRPDLELVKTIQLVLATSFGSPFVMTRRLDVS